ncbi:invasion associated locus B family protein [Amaricoccus macauensis]|uniref:invasion associated locus B family protein n=1 Tax=Amaricoccus macauensis TaxID=57001 RepID=UPI003C7DFFBF
MKLQLLAATLTVTALSLGASAWAQEAQPAPAAPAPAAPGSQVGDPAQGEIRIKLRETHGDWDVRCAPDESECFMYQLARDQNENPVAEINIVRLDNDSPASAGVTILTPLGTLLRPGLSLSVDGGERRSYPFIWCDAGGCFARFALSEEEVAVYEQGTNATLTLFSVGAPGTPVDLQLSLSGFTAAMDALEPIPN